MIVSFACLYLFLGALVASASTCRLNPAVYDFKVGAITGTVISDGPAFFPNLFSVPDKAVKRAYQAVFRSTNPLVWQQNVGIFDTPGGRFLVDAGSVNIPFFSFFDSAGRLLENMEAAGIPPSSIDAVLLTHAHPDHVSGIARMDGSAAFPNANVYIGKVDHEFWSADGPNPTTLDDGTYDEIVRVYKRSIKPYGKRLHLVPTHGSPLPGVKFVFTPGHSPGHNVIEINAGNQTIAITGDSWISKPDQMDNPDWSFFVETNPAQAFRSRIKTFKRATKRQNLVLSYHEDFPGLGYIVKSGTNFDWVPAQTQLLGVAVKKVC